MAYFIQTDRTPWKRMPAHNWLRVYVNVARSTVTRGARKSGWIPRTGPTLGFNSARTNAMPANLGASDPAAH
jgi:hypothetical protein